MSTSRAYPGIRGHLEVYAYHEEERGPCINLHGDPAGLRSLTALLLALADLDQSALPDLPDGAREHVHLDRDWQLSHSSHRLIVGRLEARGDGSFPERFSARSHPRYRPAT